MDKTVVWFNQAPDNKVQSAILLFLCLILISGCDQSEPPPAELSTSVVASGAKSAVIPEPASSLQYPVPDRAPIEMISLSRNIYESICILGNPLMVQGWSLNPDTRFIYFAGPFIMSANKPGSETYPYLYRSIDSLSRQRVNTTMRLRSIEEPERTKPDELQQFLLPHLSGVDANPREIKRLLGEPDVTRKLKKSGRTQIIYDKRICFGEKLMVGMYLDIANGVVVKAKGIAHPERLKWVISGNRPPAPDTEPTYYLDQKPLKDSPQAILMWFIMNRESGDQALGAG